MDFNFLNPVRAILSGRKKGAEQASDALLAPDGSIVTWGRLIGVNAKGEVVVALEDTGELRVVPLGYDGTNLDRLLTRPNRALQVSLGGVDQAGNDDSLLTDPNRVLWVRPFTEYVPVDPVLVPSTDGILLDGSSVLTTGENYIVEFEVVNVDGSVAATVDIWHDVAAGGAPAGAAEYIMRSAVIPVGGTSGVKRCRIGGGDDIRGVATVANDAAIRFISIFLIQDGPI